MGQRMQDVSIDIAWLAKWAAELLPKYVPGDDGKTPCERIRKESFKVPSVLFGEAAMHLPMKRVSHNNGEPSRRMGAWLGVIERTEEAMIGTNVGVAKCRTVSRLPGEKQWNRELVLQMNGSPWQPIFGRASMHIFVDVEDDSEHPDGDHERDVGPAEVLDDEVPVEMC